MTIAPPSASDPWAYVLGSWADPKTEPDIDAFAVLGYEPICKPRLAARERGEVVEPCGQCPQERFHAATEDDVLYGGAAGGGKTKSLLMEGLRSCVRFPGIWVGAYRRTYDELAESLLKELEKLHYAEALGARWNKTDKELTFPRRGGRTSKMRFRYAETVDDATRRQGGDYQELLVDERTLMPPGVVAVLAERLRSSDPAIPVIGLRSTANPGGASHGEVKAEYIDATERGAKVVTDEAGRTIRFIPAKLSDNPYLDRDASYHRILNSIKDPARRKAMKDGDWDVFAGQFFCYDEATDILTIDGWQPVAKVATGDLVATMAPDGEMTFAPATDARQFPYSGDLYVHDGEALNFAVTPGHRMYTRGRRSTLPFQLIPVEDMPQHTVHLRAAGSWTGEQLGIVTIGDGHRRYAKRPTFTFEPGDWAEFMGWWLTEGFTERNSSGSLRAGHLKGVGITQSADPVKIERIRQLLERMGLRFSFDDKRFRVASVVLAEHLASQGKHHEKFIPRDLLAAPPDVLSRLFDALMSGDGHTTASGAVLYATTSRQLADDVQDLAVRLGRVATIAIVEPKSALHRRCYRVSVYQPSHDRSLVHSNNVHRRHYDGLVSCVTVEPHHTVLVRRGGKAMWCGNSEWRHDRHVVEPFPVPAEWEREEGIDYGRSAPWAVEFGAFDQDGRCWIWNELYEAGVDGDEQARRILKVDGDEVNARHADTNMWAKISEANTIADTYADEGCEIRKAVKDRVNGWARVHHYLAEMPACPIHQALGWETCPRLHVFSNCVDLIRTLPNAPRDKLKPEDIDTKCEDHALDALRYLLMGRGVPIEPVSPVEVMQENVWSTGESTTDFDSYGDYAAGGGYADYGR